MTLAGLYVPLITPFDAAGGVALPALRSLAHQVLDGGATGLVALGTTGEPSSLTPAERHDVVDVIARACRDREAELIAGTDVIARAHRDGEGELIAGTDVIARAHRDGDVVTDVATAALCLVPPFLRPGERGVLAHFAALAAASPVPVVAYHVPYRTGQTLGAAALRELAAIPGVSGIKYAVGGIDATTVEFLADPPPGFAVLGGDDLFVSPLLAMGAHGGILASAHVATAGYAELIAAWHAGDATRARAIGHRLTALSAALFAEPNPTVIKAVLHAQGRIPTPAVRPPLLPAGPPSVEAALRAADAALTATDAA